MGGDDRRPRRLGDGDTATAGTVGDRRDRTALAAAYDAEWSAAQTGQPYHAFWRFRPNAREAVERALGPLAERTLLELGAGDGFSTLRLARRGARVIATELSPVGLRSIAARAESQGLAPGVAPLRADAEGLPLPESCVDLVYGENFLMYVDPATVGREAARVLRAGGRAVFLEPTAHHPLIRLYRRFGSAYSSTAPRYLTIEAIADLGAGFARVAHEQHYLLSVLALPLASRPFLFALAFHSLAALDRFLWRALPRLQRYGWLTVIILEQPHRAGL